MKVIDASVVVGWLLQQRQSDRTRGVLEAHLSGEDPLVAPELLSYEVCNALVARARLPVAVARQAYDLFDGLEIELYSLGAAEHDRAIELAAAHGISAYDAAYGALAQALGCRLVTADRRLAGKLPMADLV